MFLYIYIITNRGNEALVKENDELRGRSRSRSRSKARSSTSRLKDWIRKDEINEAYEFDASYDGTIGKESLIFREAMMNYFDDAKLELDDDFNERKLIKRIQKALTGDAKLKLAADNKIRRTGSFDEFIKWFDKTFQL